MSENIFADTLEEIARRERSDSPGKVEPSPSPSLMIFVDRRLSPEAWQHIRQGVSDPRCLIFEPGFTVFQLVDGRWQPVNSTREADND